MRLSPKGMLLLTALLASQGAFAEEPEGEEEKSKLSGSVGVLYGFKPAYYEGESRGRWGLLSATLSYKLADRLSLSATQSVHATFETLDKNEEQARLTDPVFTLSHARSLATDLRLAGSVSAAPGVSKNSMKEHYLGSTSASFTLSKAIERLSLGITAFGSKRWNRWTFSTKGTRNLSHVYGAGVTVSLDLSPLTLLASYSQSEAAYYEGQPAYSYQTQLGASLAVTEQVSLSLGITHSDSQLTPSGDERNYVTFYKINQSEMYVGATVAF